MDISKLKGHVSDFVYEQLPIVIQRYNINTPLRMVHFLAQCSHESGGFRAVTENLNYSADGLRKIFGKYFSGDIVNQYARKPEKIASRVYANRMGNGDESTGEGWTFRGRGYIQLTGKNNYRLFSESIGEDVVSNPDLVATRYPLVSAAWFFHRNNLNTICDRGISETTIRELTRRINGGFNGLDHRISETRKFAQILGVI